MQKRGPSRADNILGAVHQHRMEKEVTAEQPLVNKIFPHLEFVVEEIITWVWDVHVFKIERAPAGE